MKKHDTSSVALTLAALTLTGSAVAQDSDWSQLDQDIQALSANLQGTGGGIEWGGRVRAFYENSGDVSVPGASATSDLSGFSVYNARLYAHGDVMDHVGVRVEVDFAQAGGSRPFSFTDTDTTINDTDDGTGTPTTTTTSQLVDLGGSARLLDAYVDTRFSDNRFTIRAGQFRAHVLQSSLYDSGDLLFADRSIPAAMFAGRGVGIAALGSFDAFKFGVSLQNGGDGLGDEFFFAVRGQFDITGNGADLIEGAYGAGEDLDASVGAAFFSDEAVDDADGIAIDGSIATERFSVAAAFVALGDGVSTSTMDVNERRPLGIAPIADSTPFSIDGSVMLTDPDSDDTYGDWELAVRFQDLDDNADSRVYDVGLNYYAKGMGHNMKYIINWTSVDSDSVDGDLVRVGVQARF